jgi:hypothetical protein
MSGSREDTAGASPESQPEARAEGLPAWEEVETGRYRPRRIRGSFLGAELG